MLFDICIHILNIHKQIVVSILRLNIKWENYYHVYYIIVDACFLNCFFIYIKTFVLSLSRYNFSDLLIMIMIINSLLCIAIEKYSSTFLSIYNAYDFL